MKLQKLLSEINNVPGVLSAEEIPFSEVQNILKEKLVKKDYELAQVLSGTINVIHIFYKSRGYKVSGYLVLPKQLSQPLPVIIHNRGGAGDFGSIRYGLLWGRIGEKASWGYAVFASQYAGNGGGTGNEDYAGEDIKDSLFFKEIIDNCSIIDSERIGMVGGSRGGAVTYRILSKVKWIKAAVVSAGLTNFERNAKQRKEMRGVYKDMFGGSKEEMRKRSAVYFADKISKKTPILIMHGLCDWRVDPKDSMDLSLLLQENKVPHKLILFEGTDHQFTQNQESKKRETKDWLERFVKNKGELPSTKKEGR